MTRITQTTVTALGIAAALILAACSGTADSDSGAAEPQPATEAPDESAAEPDDEPYYSSSDVINILVPGSVGGGSDTQARFLTPYLEKHVEGNPRFIIENAPDQTQIAVLNDFFRDPPLDGSYLLYPGFSGMMPSLIGQEGVEYRLSDFEPVIGVALGGLVYANANTTGITGIESLVDWGGPPLVAGMQGSIGGGANLLLALENLCVPYTSIPGYDGTGAMLIALQQGELDVTYSGTSAYMENAMDAQEAGQIVPLFSYGQLQAGELVRDPMFPDLPHLGEAAELVCGEPPSGDAWDAFMRMLPLQYSLNKIVSVPAGTDPRAVEALREGFERVLQDPEFNEEKLDLLGEYDIYIGDDLDAAMEIIRSVEPEDFEWLLGWLRDEHQIETD